MKARAMLFSAPMVRAILKGRKTQTRRVVKPAGAVDVVRFIGADNQPTGEFGWCPHPCYIEKHIRCPYGQPGDRLWVRETFAVSEVGALLQGCWYRATQDDFVASLPESLRENAEPPGGKWKPSIFMPRWASRITLGVTGVRVERLQDISEQQAHDEGVDNFMCAAAVGKSPYKAGPATIMGFAHLWESINGPGSWNANPWVWVIEFKRVQP